MKKTMTAIIAMIMVFCFCGTVALAKEAPTPAKVFVTVADESGKLALAQEEITVTDADDDGQLTINDALFAAHEAKYPGGAAAGYGSVDSQQYGLSLTKLWGTDNGGSYGYYVNNVSAMNLGESVKDGDYINAFVYTDLTNWSDSYSWFDKNTAEVKSDEEITVELKRITINADWIPVTVNAQNATITVDGKATAFKTDADGKAKIKVEKAGKHIISAVSDDVVLVPPVLTLTVTEAAPKTDNNNSTTAEAETKSPATGDNSNPVIWIAVMFASCLCAAALVLTKKVSNEK